MSQCIDDLNSVKVQGNLESQKTTSLSVQVRKCRDRPNCKSEEEIDKFIESVSISYYYSNYEFNVNKFGDRSQIIESTPIFNQD